MKVVTFRSERFSLTPLPDAINDVLGHDLAGWLLAQLRARGYDADDVIGEDYGYGFWLRLERSQFWVNMARDESDDADASGLPQWRIDINDDPGCLWIHRLRARPSPERQRRLAQDIHAVLLSDPAIRDIQWWSHSAQTGAPTTTP